MEPFQKRIFIHRGSVGGRPPTEHRGSFSGLPAGLPTTFLERRRCSSGSGGGRRSEKRGSVSFVPVGSLPGYGTFKDPEGHRDRDSDGDDDDNFSSSDVLWKAERKMSRVSASGIDNPVFVEELEFKEINLGYAADVRRRSLGYLKKELEIDYHQVPIGTLYNRYGTDPNKGIGEEQRKRNLEVYGKNVLTPPKKEHILVTFLKTLVGGFQLLLWAGGILSFAAYGAQCFQTDSPPSDNLWLGIVLVVLVIVLGLFTFYQEYSSSRIMESFGEMVPSFASVIRGGQTLHVNATELVVGDIVEVKFGDRIPADIRILEASGFKVDNSSLTGESEPQSRTPLCTNENPMETKNLAFFSTNALEGTAKGLVVSVGDNTFIGRIAGLTSGLDSSDTPMAREVARFVKLISALAVFFGVAFFVIAVFMGYKWIDAVLFLIGIIVANVPEGLLVTFTVILALTAKRMANKNCLVKNLHAVETLGSCSVICSDKTGTLTQNKMTVSHMWYNNTVLDTKVDEVKGHTHLENHGFKTLATVASLCSRAKFLGGQDSVPIAQRQVDGDASESAILRTMEHYFDGVEKFQEARKKVFEIPFNSTNKYQVSIHDLDDPKDRRYLLVMKGAPERILDVCSRFTIGDGVVELDDEWRSRFNTVYEQLGGLGERVIGFCNLRLPLEMYPPGYKFSIENTDFIDIGLEFAGLISMIDPPRPGVADAVQTCRSAGIKVVMVTGDHPITAKAIARSVGIISEGTDTVEDIAQKMGLEVEDVDPNLANAAVVTGLKLTDMNSDELDECLRNHSEIVFARVSPQQKLIIVEGFQRLGRIVAVTGDGVNDSPALKKADIGIAMGIAGSDVSKQAADMILLDDNFASIVTGVEEGRLIFDNLKKCICYLLTANIAELTPFVAYICLRIPLPLGTIPMLLICLGTDIMPTISLSYEKAEGDIMKRPARDPVKDNLVTDKLISYSYGQLGLIESAAGFFTYFVVMGQNGWTPSRLMEIGSVWDDSAINDLADSYGQEWTYSSRVFLLHTCWTSYFIAVVICQWGNVLISKTRRVSLIDKLFDNWVVFFAIVFMTCLACFFSYTPGMSAAIGMEYVKINWWLPALPFFFFIVIYDEMRRFILRNFNWAWYEKEFYY